MGFDKTVEAKLFGVTVQNADIRMTAGDSSGGTFTAKANPLRGTMLWDKCMYVLQDVLVAGGATGGSYNVSVETNVVPGHTNLPIATIGSLGPNSPTTVILDNVHQSPASPMPTHININQTAGGGGLNLQCHAFAKQYRGTLGSPGVATAERVIAGNMLRGLSNTVDFSGDEGISADTTFALGTSGSALGMHRMRLWDTALYWVVVGATIAGTHSVDIVAEVDGTTFIVAASGAGTINVATEIVPLPSNFYGQSPNPSAIIWTENTTGGISDFQIVVMAKGGRGSLAKR